jgi:hypothetical protein
MEWHCMQNSRSSTARIVVNGGIVGGEPFRKSLQRTPRFGFWSNAKMKPYYAWMHHFILLCGVAAAFGFGLLITFNKRVAEEREQRAVVNMVIDAPLSHLTKITVVGI